MDTNKRGGGGGVDVKHSGEIGNNAAATGGSRHAQTTPNVVDADVPGSSQSQGAPSRWDTAVARLATSQQDVVGKAVGDDSTSNRSSKHNESGNALGDSAVNVDKSDTITKKVTDVSDDPLQDIPTDRTPIKNLIEKLNDDDKSLTVLKLDGRTQIKEDDWKSLFQSLEANSTLTHLSISRCELTDDVALALVLAMVVNETVVALRLNHNESLTDETGKGFIKVLRQSNCTIKKLEVTRTKITTKLSQELNNLLEERNNTTVTTANIQERHRTQIELLMSSFSAGDAKKKEGFDRVSEAVDYDGSHHRRRSFVELARSVTASKKSISKK